MYNMYTTLKALGKKAFAAATQNGFPCNSRLSTLKRICHSYTISSNPMQDIASASDLPPEQMIVHEPHTLRAEL